MKCLTRHQIVGKFISKVTEGDVPRDIAYPDFQARKTIVHLEDGLKICLMQEHYVIDQDTGVACISPYLDQDSGKIILERSSEPRLNSPIKAVIQPFEWDYYLGLLLQNRFMLIVGFSESSMGLAVLELDKERYGHLYPELQLPESQPPAELEQAAIGVVIRH